MWAFVWNLVKILVHLALYPVFAFLAPLALCGLLGVLVLLVHFGIVANLAYLLGVVQFVWTDFGQFVDWHLASIDS